MNGLKVGLQKIAYFMYGIAGVALVGIMFLTVADVFLRLFKMPIVGTYEIVSLLGAVVIGFAIPQTTLERGHVLMDFLTGRLHGGVQRVLHLFTRLIAAMIFLIIGWNLFVLGNDLLKAGQVSLTLKMPEYPVAFGIAFCCLLQCLVLLADLIKKEGAEA
ncbi:MAG: TRAP transporter small permease [Desulfobacteraceae bacterium]|nr:MAG: TRAP transporter small permease [Desulfobacteraceae bacterium]